MSELKSRKTRKPGQSYKHHVFICQGKTCAARMAQAGTSAEEAKSFFKEKIKEADLSKQVRTCTASCFNFCDDGPNIVVYPEAVWYSGVTREDWPEIFERHLLHGKRVERLTKENQGR